MSNIILNFFGEKISINKPKNLSSLRKEISRVFFLNNQDAAEMLLTYKEKGKKLIIVNEEDFQKFFKSKNQTIDLDINQNSQIYKENLNKLKEEKNLEKTLLEQYLKKKEELTKLKESKFKAEKKKLKEIEEKIKELTQRKKKIKKYLSKSIKKIEKKIKQNDKKIEELQKKVSLEKNSSNQKLKSIHYKLKGNKEMLKNSKNLYAYQNNLKLLLEDNLKGWEVTNETRATGPYADWRNNAITNPTKGQLLPSGFVTIKFNKLNDAVKYEGYVDSKLVKTFQGSEAQANNLEFEIRNNEVKKHSTWVVATLANGEQVVSNLRYFFISKKGIGIWQSQADQIKEMNLTWYYTWSVNPLSGVSNNAEYVPMIWGNLNENSFGDRKKEWDFVQNQEWKNYRYLLTFNEPDFPDQANMSPEQAVDKWRYIQPIVNDPKVDVSSPVVAIPTVFYEDTNNNYNTVGGWFGKYNQLMNASRYNDEFIAVHFYFDYPGEWVINTFRKIHELTGKKLWITEWGIGQWSQVQSFDWIGGPDEGNWQREMVVKFMKEILPVLDQTDYIERYAWFPFDGSNREKFGNGAGGLFFNTESDPLYKQLTAVGKTYKELGNPLGWEPNKVYEDKVLKVKEGGDEDSGENKINVLLGKRATSSSQSGSNSAEKAIDSDLGTRWESQHGKNEPEWLMIDLGDTYAVDGFKIVWESASAKEYKIQVSLDGNNWNDVYQVTDGRVAEIREDNFALVNTRFVRVLGISKTMPQYGFSIFDFQVMGVKSGNKLRSGNGRIKNKKNISNGVHFGVKCDGCGKSPINGCRYKCVTCHNFDYCKECKEKFSKKHNHPFLLFSNPKSRPIFLEKNK